MGYIQYIWEVDTQEILLFGETIDISVFDCIF